MAGLALVLATLGYFGAQRLRVDTSVEALLPGDTPTERALLELESRVEVKAPLNLLVTGPDPALNRRLAARIRNEVARWPETEWVIDRRDPSFFLDRRLLYLRADQLEELADRVEERVDWEECDAVPGCVNFDDRPELPDEEELTDMFASVESVRSLATFFGRESLGEDVSAGDAGDERIGDLCNREGTLCAVQAQIDGDENDLRFAARILHKAEAMLARVRPEDAPDDLRLEVVGRYRNAPMIKEVIQRDVVRTGILNNVLLVLILFLVFRRVRAVLQVVAPLAVGVIGALGVIGVVHPEMNLISAFTMAILGGLGIDYGIHLVTHYQAHRAKGHPPAEAIRDTIAGLVKSLLTAGVTAGCAFAALAAAEFRGFAEMGVLAAFGLAVALLSFLVFLPPVVLVLHRIWPEKSITVRAPSSRWLRGPSRRVAVAVTFAGLVIGAVAVLRSLNVELEYDFRRLQPPEIAHGLVASDAIHGTTGTAIYLVADDPRALDAAGRDLARRHYDRIVPPEHALLMTPEALVPADQERKLVAIARMRAAADRAEAHIGTGGEWRAQLRRIRPFISVDRPIGPGDLPPWIADYVVERDGTLGRVAVLYLRLRGTDAHAMEDLTRHIAGWRQRHPHVVFAAPEAVVGEVIPGLRADGPRILGLALLGLLITTALISRSLRRAVLVLVPVALAMAMSIALMVMLGIRFNLYNLLVLPVAFGIGVDGAVYVSDAMSDAPDETTRWQRFFTCARAVLGSTITNIAAYGSIIAASHPGLKSLGEVAFIALSLSLVTTLVWLPAVLSLRPIARRKKPSS